MKLYLEIAEEIDTSDLAERQPEQFRKEVLSEEHARELLAKMLAIFGDIKCKANLHICRQEENEPCELIPLM